ncbi:MAG: autoinducer binding domain-containing protein [Paracoccus sp. (in: a-proteobacteria)]|uniref:autoinducer binding domain-containing protein n=1 Tax=Paracoccus sp. TaxID=267 RepID=UPI0026DF9B6C|nr:autoinducer binding domain-containing protein [Paracoccus sp. (in: a-proteobacteria)]MDO5614533.1 autoinducer binding domain-containing protein [Paracoccus sp. (in: a-proteobacteria)]
MPPLTTALEENSTADAVLNLQGLLKVDHLTFHILNNPSAGIDNPFVRTTYPEAWVSHYLLNSYSAVDPVLQRAHSSDEPFFWSDLTLTPEAEQLMEQFGTFDLGKTGYSLIHTDAHGRKSVLSISRRDDAGWAGHVDALHDMLVQIHADLHMKAVSEIIADTRGLPQLAPRECECLRFTSQGKTYSEIAIILDLSEHTVRSYLKLARVKLNCVSLAQAVAKAVRYKII